MTRRREPRWIDRSIVLAIHTDQIRQHGGSFGLRDEGALESALARPRQRWHYDTEADLTDLAASCAFGIPRNHPFTDGNKRSAFMALYVFVGLNGWRIRAEEDEVVAMVEGLAAGAVDEAGLAGWLRERNVRRRRPRS